MDAITAFVEDLSADDFFDSDIRMDPIPDEEGHWEVTRVDVLYNIVNGVTIQEGTIKAEMTINEYDVSDDGIS